MCGEEEIIKGELGHFRILKVKTSHNVENMYLVDQCI